MKKLQEIYNNKWFWRLWLLFIVTLFCITRFWKINTLPSGLYVDEAGMAYDAWCLSEFGVDRYLKSWPVYLINYGNGQSIMYAYLTAFLFKIFGYSKLMIRLPGIIFSFLTLVFGMKIAYKLFPEHKIYAYAYGSIVTIAPYFIMASRFGLDCNLMLGMSTVFLWAFITAMDSERWQDYVIAGIAGGLTLYTYVLSHLVLPLFLLMSLLYSLVVKRFRFKNWLIMAVPMGLLALPLIMMQMVNMFDMPEMQIGIFTITKLQQYRNQSILRMPSWSRFVQTLTCILVGDDRNYDSIQGIPVLYAITDVLLIIGLISIICLIVKRSVKRIYEDSFFIVVWFAMMLILGMLITSSVYRINAIYAVAVIIALYGLKTVITLPGVLGKGLAVGIIICYLVSFFHFGNYYYRGAYAAENEPLRKFNDPISEAYEFIVENPSLSQKSTQMAQAAIYYAVSALPSPYDFENGANTGNFICGTLGTIEYEYNYIVEDEYVEYAQDLRDVGFAENKYNGYSLFYVE